MSEEIESADSGAEGTGPGVDPAAMSLALVGASREEADSFLKKQSRLIDIQTHHLHKHLRLGLWEKRLGVLLRIATAFTGLAIAAGLGFLIWNASQSNELIIDSFSVPPDLAAKGVTGEVLAGELVDRITEMQTRFPNSLRAPQSYANAFGDGIKLEIPETGISLSELDRFLREELGKNTHVSGALIRTDTGLKLTVRAGAAGSDSIQGTEKDIDTLMQGAAEAVYHRTQPYRYGVYLFNLGNNDGAISVFTELAKSPSLQERAWAYVGLGNTSRDGAGAGLRLYRHGAELDPQNYLALSNGAGDEQTLGYWEAALSNYRKASQLFSSSGHGQIREDYLSFVRLQNQMNIDQFLGDFGDATNVQAKIVQDGRAVGAGQSAALAWDQAASHDIGAARLTMEDPVKETPGRAIQGEFQNDRARMFIAMQAQDWDGAQREAAALDRLIEKNPYLASRLMSSEPYAVYAEAKLRRFDEAERRITPTPGDCYPCLVTRGQIAALQKQYARADWWFDRAVKAAASIPFAYYEWGKALKERGDLNGAIAKFKLANQKGPHFADPLEMWGEVLVAQNRSDLALAKFTEAEKYAPNWGRLHLKWGEALLWTGKSAEAQKQFARAGELDLTAAEKDQLTKVRK